MEFGDSREALFVEPNAYVQNFSHENKELKKVVFSQPYDVLPNYYLKNDFQKKCNNCDVKQQHEQCNNVQTQPLFDIKNMLPMLGGLLGKGLDVNNLASILNSGENLKSNNGSMIGNIMNILSSDMGKNIVGLLGKNNKKNIKKIQKNTNKIKSSDFCIDNYERVE